MPAFLDDPEENSLQRPKIGEGFLFLLHRLLPFPSLSRVPVVLAAVGCAWEGGILEANGISSWTWPLPVLLKSSSQLGRRAGLLPPGVCEGPAPARLFSPAWTGAHSLPPVGLGSWPQGLPGCQRGWPDAAPSLRTEDVLHTLTGAMSLLRRCRVNAALTIQLFSQLFHFINMWLFNRLLTDPESGLCSHYWGAIVRQQLGHVEAWAEKQGLELAADCHLSRVVQVGGRGPWVRVGMPPILPG